MARVHRISRVLSLRARLLIGLTVIVIAGLVAADFVVYQQIRSYLGSQMTQELLAIQPGSFTLSPTGTIQLQAGQTLPTDTYIKILLPDASVIGTTDPSVHLSIPRSIFASLANEAEQGALVTTGMFNATATGPGSLGGTYLVRPELYFVHSTADFGPRVPALAFVALPYSTFSGTLNKLLVVDIVVTTAITVALVMLAYGVIRVGLRPLEDIEVIAEEIAAGDLSRRIEQDYSGTEVGRLGAALNAMLGYIERAFRRQQASENQLRQFLADASHELRTPVTSIRGYSELFRRGAQNRPEDLALAMRRIEDEAVRMGVLVDDLLLLARLDQGRPLEELPVPLGDIATDAAADAQVVASDREISVDVDPHLVVIGDEQRLRQVVANLLQNALVHTPPGTPVELSVAADGDQVELRVTDHGPGIPPEHLEHIFERFYRADPSRARGSGGSGLGLAIVSSIVSAHHGTVDVTSVPGLGTTFIVRLPRSPASLSDGATPDRSSSEVSTPASSEPPRR